VADYLAARLRKRTAPLVTITAYDYFTALLAQSIDADFALVGDSLGNVVQGGVSTVGVTLEQMIYHTRLVCRHFPAERVVLDMPFGTFKQGAEQTVANAVRAFQESGCGGVKLEGADPSSLTAIGRLRAIGIPVVAHLGLLPQRVHADGGYRMQGKTAAQAKQLLAEARALEAAGALALVLECVMPDVAGELTAALQIPTIGIGSGPHCGGQILVVHDLLGMLPGPPPSFVKQYADLYAQAMQGVTEYAREVRTGQFPNIPSGTAAPTAKVRRPEAGATHDITTHDTAADGPAYARPSEDDPLTPAADGTNTVPIGGAR
jgi:3-methyl-2-oxobutanoate hydroxymethyltransferase